MRGLIAGFLILAASVAPAPAQTAADVRATAPALEKNLTENILRFWYPGTIDREHGGFLIDHDAQGRFKGEAPKAIVTQARMVWLSSRLMREGRGGPAMAEAARQGYRFLLDKMWDREYGGFYWEVDRTGTRVAHANKHLYGQAFGLYAIAEYARATGIARRSRRRAAAVRSARGQGARFASTAAIASSLAVTGARPRPTRDRTWARRRPEVDEHAPPPDGGVDDALPRRSARRPWPCGSPSSSHSRATPSCGSRTGACTDRYAADWTPKLDGTAARASYGHDLENIWLLADALDALGQSASPLRDLSRELFALLSRQRLRRGQRRLLRQRSAGPGRPIAATKFGGCRPRRLSAR